MLKRISLRTSVFVIILLLIYASDWIWPEHNGSYDLGNNIYMLEWDGGGKIIVNGTRIKGNTCYSGESLIPTYENQYDSLGHFAEYVVDAKADDSWIIVKTNNHINNQRNYYILDKRHNTNKISAQDIINLKSADDLSRFKFCRYLSHVCLFLAIQTCNTTSHEPASPYPVRSRGFDRNINEGYLSIRVPK